MKKVKIILGNITFHHFSDEELKLFKNQTNDVNERKALVHHVDDILEVPEDLAGEIAELMLNNYESYLIPEEFDGEIVFEEEEKIDYLIMTENDEWLSTGKQQTQKQLKEELEMKKAENPDVEVIVFTAKKMENFSY